MTKTEFVSELRSYVVITLALMLSGVGWGCFVIPSDIVGGGLMGLSTLIYISTGLPVGPVNFVSNMLLILIAMKIIGKGFGFKTIYSLAVLSFFVSVCQVYIKEPLITDRFMASVIGGIAIGGSIGILLTQGGSTGGTEIIAMIVNKYHDIMPGRIMMLCDLVIIGSSFFYFHNIESITYGYVVMICMSLSADYMLTGAKQSVQIFIISRFPGKVADNISSKLLRGISILDGKGYYSGEKREFLMMIVRKAEMHLVLKAVKEIDKDAFVSVGSVFGVYGQGFDTYKPPVKTPLSGMSQTKVVRVNGKIIPPENINIESGK